MFVILAGWMAGYAMAVICTLCLTYLCIQPRVVTVVQKYLDIPGMMFAVPISLGTGFTWTLMGMMLASFYIIGDFESKPGALGAPSYAYVLIMVALAWLPLPVMYMLAKRYWWMWVGMSLSFVGLFGWAMPILAER